MRDVLYVWEVELKFKAEINVFMVTCYTIRRKYGQREMAENRMWVC